MPIYEYECDSCEQEIEVIQKVTDKVLEECPRCHENSLKKMTSLNTFQLKGEGWYRDGYGGSTPGRSSSSGTSKSGKPTQESAKSTAA